MLGTPQYHSHSPKASHTQSQTQKHIPKIAACVCVAFVMLNLLLMQWHPRRAIDTSESDAEPISLAMPQAGGFVIDAAAATDAKVAYSRTVSSSSSSSSTDSSREGNRLHDVLHAAEDAASQPPHGSESNAASVVTGFEQAAQVLVAAGIQLGAVQQMQLDRIRMQAELHARGRLQKRRRQLEAELKQTIGAADASSNQQLLSTTSSSSSSKNKVYSRGILIVAGSRDHMANALISIIILRHVLNSTLPIELVYYAADDHDPLMLKFLQEYINSEGSQCSGITIINGSEKQIDLAYHHQSWGSSSGRADMFGAAASITGYAAKAHALAYVTSFQQVLLLDSDNLPLMDPAQLFDSGPFVKHGNLFWPDFWKRMWIKEDFYTRLGQDVPWETDDDFNSAESGQILIDRLQHVDMLEWLWWLNSHKKVTYRNMLGDKDTYRLAFALANKASAYQQVKRAPRDALAIVNGTSKIQGMAYVHQGMLQHTPDGRPAFLHRTAGAKLFPNCAERVDASACKVRYFTVPLTEMQAMLAMRRDLAYAPTGVDIQSYPAKCNDKVPIDPDRPDDPSRCDLKQGLSVVPVPLVPVSEFTKVDPILRASYAVFEQVKKMLAMGQKLQGMQLQGMNVDDNPPVKPLAEKVTFQI